MYVYHNIDIILLLDASFFQDLGYKLIKTCGGWIAGQGLGKTNQGGIEPLIPTCENRNKFHRPGFGFN